MTRDDLTSLIASSDLSRLDLSDLDLHALNFRGAALRAADLSGARKGGPNLKDALLNAAGLTQISLVGANPHRANLSGVYLHGRLAPSADSQARVSVREGGGGFGDPNPSADQKSRVCRLDLGGQVDGGELVAVGEIGFVADQCEGVLGHPYASNHRRR
jgi:uncharacterized protein YjbI with pentapeptide repeats